MIQDEAQDFLSSAVFPKKFNQGQMSILKKSCNEVLDQKMRFKRLTVEERNVISHHSDSTPLLVGYRCELLH